MAIKPKCKKCKIELIKFGAILYGPPKQVNDEEFCKKIHLCKKCYKSIVKMINETNKTGERT